MASQTVIEALRPHVDELLQYIAEAIGEPGMASALVTDRSMLADFLPSKEQVEVISDKLGFDVVTKDYIYEIAIRIRDNK